MLHISTSALQHNNDYYDDDVSSSSSSTTMMIIYKRHFITNFILPPSPTRPFQLRHFSTRCAFLFMHAQTQTQLPKLATNNFIFHYIDGLIYACEISNTLQSNAFLYDFICKIFYISSNFGSAQCFAIRIRMDWASCMLNDLFAL